MTLVLATIAGLLLGASSAGAAVTPPGSDPFYTYSGDLALPHPGRS